MSKIEVGALGWEDAVAMMRSELHKVKWGDDIFEDFVERRDRMLDYVLKAFLSERSKHFVFPTVGAARLKKIWLDFGRSGVVRDDKGMTKIADQVLNNIALLDVTNALSGHSQDSPEEMIENAGYEIDMEKLMEFLTDPNTGGWYVSDYGLPYLLSAYVLIMKAETAENLLIAVDKALNVVHQRSDLASWFVEGGIKTLQEVSTQV